LGNTRGRDNLEDLDLNGRIILKLLLDKLDWSHVVTDAAQWWGPANTLMGIRVLSDGGEFFEYLRLFYSQEGLCSMRVVHT
jgi:hypothetical protein